MYAVYELLLNNVAEPMLYGGSSGVSTGPSAPESAPAAAG